MDVAEINRRVADIPNLPNGVKRSEIVFVEVFCCEGDFAAGQLASGKFAAIWTNSVEVEDTLGSLSKEKLNKHENTLLAYEIKK